MILGSIVLLWWFAMLICQGEGLLDLLAGVPDVGMAAPWPSVRGRRSLAEMLAPLSANLTYWTAPIFTGILYRTVPRKDRRAFRAGAWSALP